MIEICPKCNEKAFIKTPVARRFVMQYGSEVTTAHEHKYKCHNCNYETEIIREETDFGKLKNKPWWKLF